MELTFMGTWSQLRLTSGNTTIVQRELPKEAIERMRRLYLEDNAHEELKDNLGEPIPGPPLVGSYETLGPLRTPPRLYHYPDDAVTVVQALPQPPPVQEAMTISSSSSVQEVIHIIR